MKATEVLYLRCLLCCEEDYAIFAPVDNIVKCYHDCNESYTEQYFPVVLFVMLYKVVL